MTLEKYVTGKVGEGENFMNKNSIENTRESKGDECVQEKMNSLSRLCSSHTSV